MTTSENKYKDRFKEGYLVVISFVHKKVKI